MFLSPRRLLPHPLLSVLLMLVWLLLVNSYAPGQFILGITWGILIPRVTDIFWTEQTSINRPASIVKLCAAVISDIIAANVVVARRILGPVNRLRPAFVEYPLELNDPVAVTLLAGIISLTPGTVSANLNPDRTVMLIHCLHLDDEEELVQRIRQRYEIPLKEIFACCR
jgi:multicomponent K+:H+ antiporter subunit E